VKFPNSNGSISGCLRTPGKRGKKATPYYLYCATTTSDDGKKLFMVSLVRRVRFLIHCVGIAYFVLASKHDQARSIETSFGTVSQRDIMD
jgi:hypothetical protein